MDDKIVTLAVYSNVIEAQLARNQLVAEGIPARLDGDTAGGPLPGMETTFGSIHLLVPESVARQACEVLGFDVEEFPEPGPLEDEDEEDDPSRTAIREQDAGGIRKPREDETPPSTATQPSSPYDQSQSAADEPDAPALLEDDEELEERLSRRLTWSVDDYAARALRAAVIGLILLPPLLHVYSLWLLVRMAFLSEEASPAAMRKVYLALVIDVVVLIAVALAFRSVWQWTDPLWIGDV